MLGAVSGPWMCWAVNLRECGGVARERVAPDAGRAARCAGDCRQSGSAARIFPLEPLALRSWSICVPISRAPSQARNIHSESGNGDACYFIE